MADGHPNGKEIKSLISTLIIIALAILLVSQWIKKKVYQFFAQEMLEYARKETGEELSSAELAKLRSDYVKSLSEP